MVLSFFGALQSAVEQQTCQTEADGDTKDDDGLPVFLRSQCIAAHGGTHQGRQAAHGRNHEPAAHGDVCQAHAVGQYVFGCSRQHKGCDEERVHPLGVPQQSGGKDFFPGNKDLHCLDTKSADECKDQSAADGHTNETENGAFPEAEGVACTDLQRFAGDNGHKDLQCRNGHKGNSPPKTMRVHPRPEFIRLGNKLHQRLSHKPENGCGQQDEYGDAAAGKDFFLFLCHGSILKVSAKDKATGKEQAIRIEASSGLSKDEIERMKAEAEANADADKKEREKIDKLNQADSMVFQTENQLKELGDKIPADKKAPIEAAAQKLKEAHKAQDLAAIDAATAELNNAWQAASAEMYAQSGAQGGAQGAGAQGAQGGQQASGSADDVQDAEFEEVK